MLDKKERYKQQKEFDLKAKKLRLIQQDKNNKELLEITRLKEEESLSRDIISIDLYFNKSGIYFLFKETKLVYIGESYCIYSRIAQHLKENVKEFNHFKIYKLIENQQLRKRTEKSLIKKYKPLLNFTHNLDKIK